MAIFAGTFVIITWNLLRKTETIFLQATILLATAAQAKFPYSLSKRIWSTLFDGLHYEFASVIVCRGILTIDTHTRAFTKVPPLKTNTV
mmetsp:Transcript_32811/g.49469  ORF Transcript_32811/g.49469 Transcript_32811/m.49469 type:complete len:89 (-) Transcript_32811:3108-3374(-)